MFKDLFVRLTGPWFKPKDPVSLTSEGGYSLQEIPIGECSHDLGLNDDEEMEAQRLELVRAKSDLEEMNRKVARLENWFAHFEDLSWWMHEQKLWDAEDVDHENPMQTYKNGLTRFLKEHNIPIK